MTATNDNKLILSALQAVIYRIFLLSLPSSPYRFLPMLYERGRTAFTAMVGFLVFKEQITKNGLIGIILIIAGVVLMRGKEKI